VKYSKETKYKLVYNHK